MTATAPASLSELAERIDEQVKETLRLPVFDLARGAAQEAGLARARGVLRDAPALLSGAQEARRSCQLREAEAKDAYEAAQAEAEWELDSFFEMRGNKTVLVRGPNGDLPEDQHRPMTADDRKAWKAVEARKFAVVAKAADALRKAEQERQAGADGVAYAERCFTAARLEVEASIAQLNALASAIRLTRA